MKIVKVTTGVVVNFKRKRIPHHVKCHLNKKNVHLEYLSLELNYFYLKNFKSIMHHLRLINNRTSIPSELQDLVPATSHLKTKSYNFEKSKSAKNYIW